MTARMQTTLMAAVLALATSGFYLWRLDQAPIHLTRAEVFVSLTAHSLAAKGRDLEGRFLPAAFYSRVHGDWWTPVLPYMMAGTLKVLPFSERSVRTPLALAAVVNVVLVFLIGRLLFERRSLTLVPAVLLALAPPQVIYNRYANDSGLPATFALAWMLCALMYLRHGRGRALFGAGLALGFGFLSYVGAVITMTLYAGVTAAALCLRRDRPMRYVVLAAGFALPIAIVVPWFIGHPEALRATFFDYQARELASGDTLSAVKGFGTLRRAGEIAQLYVHFFDPSFLFVTGSPMLMHSTGRVGVYLLPAAGFLLVGLIVAARRAIVDPRVCLLLGGFLLTPLPPSIVDFNDHLSMHAIWRAVEVVPFGALLAGLGLEYTLSGTRTRVGRLAQGVALGLPLGLVLWYGSLLPHSPRIVTGLLMLAALACVGAMIGRPRAVTVAVTALGVAALVQFADFYRDYMTHYRTRFAATQTDGNTRDVLGAIIARSPVAEPSRQQAMPAIYLGWRLGAGDWGSYYWRFYLHKHGREDLLLRTIDDTNASQFNHDRICRLPPGSLVATRSGWDPAADTLIQQMTANGELHLEQLVRGEPTYWLLRTTGTCRTE